MKFDLHFRNYGATSVLDEEEMKEKKKEEEEKILAIRWKRGPGD